MPDLNVDLNFPEHRKTKRTVGLLGRGSDILPIRLWLYCGRNHPEDGRLIGYSTQEIESVCDWWGEKGKMVEAFLSIGWLDTIEGGFQVHEWQEHQGHLKSYKERAKQAAIARWSRIPDATSMLQAMPNGPPSNASTGTVKIGTAKLSAVPSLPKGESEGGGEKPIPPEVSILDHLCQKTGRGFRPIDVNLKPIAARLAEVGGDADGVRQMIDRQCARWKCTEQEEFLRPETLFGKTKFHSYYAAKDMPVNNATEKSNGQRDFELPTYVAPGRTL